LISLDISENRFLTILNCSNNQLTDLDLTNNNLLENLYCRGNNSEIAIDWTPNYIYYPPIQIEDNEYYQNNNVDPDLFDAFEGQQDAYDEWRQR